MKLLLLIGGCLGFGIGLFFSWLDDNGWPVILWHASLAAYLGGHLFKWWGGAWRRSLENDLLERRTRPSPARLASLPKAVKS